MRKLFTLSGGGKTILSLLLITSLTACNSEESSLPTKGNQLQLSFGINAPQSRAIFTDTKLPDASPVGVRLDGYADYANLVYTGSTTSGTQSWSSTTSVTLTDTKGTLYAYWPQNNAVAIDAIDVDMTAADQTDWLYATPVTDVSEDKASVAVTMNHALANINVTVNKGTYLGAGNITNITLQSDGIALGGTFNAAQATPGYTAFEDEGKPLSRTISTTAGAAATDIMVVPTGTPAPITFLLTIDGIQFTATSESVWITMGNSYQYTLNLSDISTYMEISGFSVKPWTSTTGGTLELEEFDPWANVANGVYVVTATGQLVDKSAATPDCIGVAFISANQKVMIAKEDATDGTNNTLFWGRTINQQDVPNLENFADNTAAKADYNGKANTAAIIAGYAALGKDMYSQDMCKVLQDLNAGTSSHSNEGFNDWYVPSAGQLYEFFSNRTAINEALTAISGNSFTSNYYWSSSEMSASYAWCVNFSYDDVVNSAEGTAGYVRFVRDLQ